MKRLSILTALVATAGMGLPALATAQTYAPASRYDNPAYSEPPGYQGQSQGAWADYQQRLRTYEEQRAAYDRDQAWRQGSSRQVDDGRNASRYDSSDRYRGNCRDGGSARTVTGGMIGAIAGAAIGSNVAGRGSRTEGAVLGAVAGGALGASVANSQAQARCDQAGYYYTFNQTHPYREPASYRNQQSGQYGYAHYRASRCRLVVAPTQWEGGQDARYARVCPDRMGRYRLTE